MGLVAFIAGYIVLLGFSVAMVGYSSGSIGTPLDGLPMPLVIGALVAIIAFIIRESN